MHTHLSLNCIKICILICFNTNLKQNGTVVKKVVESDFSITFAETFSHEHELLENET